MSIHIYPKSTNHTLSILNSHPVLTTDECKCHCADPACTATLVSTQLIQCFWKLRAKYGQPIQVDCCYRCPNHNQKVGGAPQSQHLCGQGLDLSPKNRPHDFTLDGFAKLALSVGFTWVKVYPDKNFVHCDVRDE